MANVPIRIIIEGSNYCGKDAILDALVLLCKNAVIVTTRGYWRRALMEKGSTRDDLLAYFKNRALSYLAVAKAVQHDELIFVRLHLTDIVYSELYLQAQQDYGEFEDALNELTVGLVLLDVDDATLEARRAASPRGTSGHADRSLPALIKKRALFRKAYDASRLTRQLLLNNGGGAPSPEEQAQRILYWWNTV